MSSSSSADSGIDGVPQPRIFYGRRDLQCECAEEASAHCFMCYSGCRWGGFVVSAFGTFDARNFNWAVFARDLLPYPTRKSEFDLAMNMFRRLSNGYEIFAEEFEAQTVDPLNESEQKILKKECAELRALWVDPASGHTVMKSFLDDGVARLERAIEPLKVQEQKFLSEERCLAAHYTSLLPQAFQRGYRSRYFARLNKELPLELSMLKSIISEVEKEMAMYCWTERFSYRYRASASDTDEDDAEIEYLYEINQPNINLLSDDEEVWGSGDRW